DDPPTDLLDHLCDVSVGRRCGLGKAGLEGRSGAVPIDPLYGDAMEMEGHIDRTAKTLDKRDRARVDGGPLVPLCDRLVDVVLPDGGADDGMELCREVLGPSPPV